MNRKIEYREYPQGNREHKSTYSPNMPLRGLLYFAKLYSRYVKENHLNLFSTTLQKIPTPKYVVFYNGTQDQPDEQNLKGVYDKKSKELIRGN